MYNKKIIIIKEEKMNKCGCIIVLNMKVETSACSDGSWGSERVMLKTTTSLSQLKYLHMRKKRREKRKELSSISFFHIFLSWGEIYANNIT